MEEHHPDNRPSARNFFIGEAVVWLILVCCAVQLAGPPAAIIVNLLVVLFNMVGTIICVATGWAPWKDSL